MKVLFSPIGSSDPIRNMHDGSMLHILRHYKPNKVILFLSHEMNQRHLHDNRYVYCIRKLGEELGFDFAIEVIARDDLIEVQDYEVFYEVFRELLADIVQKNPDDELLVNISSGTSAMKSGLLVLSKLGEIRYKAIQVSTPLGRSNYTDEDVDNYDAQEQWECDEDNADGTQNRCTEIHSANLQLLVQLNAIKEHIRTYNYSAATSLIKQVEDRIGELPVLYVEQAQARRDRDYSKVLAIQKKTGYSPIPVESDKDRTAVEFLLTLEIKVKRKQYDDFLRGLTPIFTELLDRALQTYCQIDYHKYCRISSKGEKWNLKAGDTLFKILQKKNSHFMGTGFIYNIQLVNLVTAFSQDEEINRLVNGIRDIEEDVRNPVAHTLVAVTERMVRTWSGHDCTNILDMLKQLAVRVHLIEENDEARIWNSYDAMNEDIIKVLNDSM